MAANRLSASSWREIASFFSAQSGQLIMTTFKMCMHIVSSSIGRVRTIFTTFCQPLRSPDFATGSCRVSFFSPRLHRINPTAQSIKMLGVFFCEQNSSPSSIMNFTAHFFLIKLNVHSDVLAYVDVLPQTILLLRLRLIEIRSISIYCSIRSTIERDEINYLASAAVEMFFPYFLFVCSAQQQSLPIVATSDTVDLCIVEFLRLSLLMITRRRCNWTQKKCTATRVVDWARGVAKMEKKKVSKRAIILLFVTWGMAWCDGDGEMLISSLSPSSMGGKTNKRRQKTVSTAQRSISFVGCCLACPAIASA